MIIFMLPSTVPDAFYKYIVIDSSGKFPPPGVLEGTLTDLGRFDECIQVNHLIEGDNYPISTRIKGQYCSLILRPPLPSRPRFHTLCNQIPSLSNLSSSNDSVIVHIISFLGSLFIVVFLI